jgi:four helix bundle protein
MAKAAFLNLRVYQLAEDVSNIVWDIARSWPRFAQNTVGTQLVSAADSIPSDIAEGYGRGSRKDQRNFMRIARGSLNESISLLRRCYKRKLLNPENSNQLATHLDELGPRLNGYDRSLVDAPPKKRGDE